MIKTCEYMTGSRRGYIPAKRRGVGGELIPVPTSIDGLRGNLRKAMQLMIDNGATYYTIADYQGAGPWHYSNNYCYSVYTGWRS